MPASARNQGALKMASTQQPAYRAFTVIERGDGKEAFWLPIGAAFRHQSGDGLNVILQALPVGNGDGTCKIVLRRPKDEDAASSERDMQARGGNDDKKSGQQRK
jgi:hypothetical protein